MTTGICQMNLLRMKQAQLTIKFIVLVGGLMVSIVNYVCGIMFRSTKYINCKTGK